MLLKPHKSERVVIDHSETTHNEGKDLSILKNLNMCSTWNNKLKSQQHMNLNVKQIHLH